MSVMEQEYLKQLYEANKKMKKLKEALSFYADRTHWDADYTDSFCCTDGWERAQYCLKEIEK